MPTPIIPTSLVAALGAWTGYIVGQSMKQPGIGLAVGAAAGAAAGFAVFSASTSVSGIQVGAGARHRSTRESKILSIEAYMALPEPEFDTAEERIEYIKRKARYAQELAQLKYAEGEYPDVNFKGGGSTYPGREDRLDRLGYSTAQPQIDSEFNEFETEATSTSGSLMMDEPFADIGRQTHGAFRATGYKVPPRGFVGWRRPFTTRPKRYRRRLPWGVG